MEIVQTDEKMNRETVVKEKIITFNQNKNRYCALELGRHGKQLTISGSCGTVMTKKDLDKQVEDYWTNIDLEDEWGYIADERGIKAKAERKQMLEQLASELKSDNYPFEVHEEVYIPEIHDDVVFDTDSGGQIDSDVCRRNVNVVGKAVNLETICKIWKQYHLKETPSEKHKQAKDLLNKFPSYEDFAKEWALKSVHVQTMTDSKIKPLDEFRRK